MYKRLNKGIKSVRTGKNTVALLGLAETTRHLCPFDDPDTEIWCLNESYILPFIKRYDRWFQMHARANFMRKDNHNDPNHPAWLKSASGFPIYMLRKHKDIPMSVRFPLEEVTEVVGGRRYFTSSIAFMLGLAMLEGFERIELYGFEMASDTEYAYQRCNAEYLLGVATGKGIDVWLPQSCGVLTGKLYGYEKISLGFRQALERTRDETTIEKDRTFDLYNKFVGAIEYLESAQENIVPLNTKEEIEVELQNLRLQRNGTQAKVNALNGKIVAYNEILKAYDKYPFEVDREEDDE